MNFKFFPNPAATFIYGKGSTSINDNSKINIYNSIGALVKTVELNNSSKLQINVSDLVSGVYFLKVISNINLPSKAIKFIVVR